MSNKANAKQAEAANRQSWDMQLQAQQYNANMAGLEYERNQAAMNEANWLTRGNMAVANEYQRGINREAMDFSHAEAGRQMDFQERMANTQHRREVADLYAAGLNPILSGTGGMGAVAPAGASGTAASGGSSGPAVHGFSSSAARSGQGSGQQAHLADILGPAVSSALSTYRQLEEVKLLRDQQVRTQAETTRTLAEARRTGFQADLDPTFAHAERLEGVRKTAGEASTAQAEGERRTWLKHVDRQYIDEERSTGLKLLKNQAAQAHSTARSAAVAADLDEDLREIERLLKMGLGGTSAVRSLRDAFRPTPKGGGIHIYNKIPR